LLLFSGQLNSIVVNKNLTYILFFAAIPALFSCKDKTEYRVGSDFEIYVQHFEQEAATRNRTFNFKSSGLIIEFSDLKEGVAGLCNYEKPIRIEVDKAYWDSLGLQNGTDQMREELIFHEMGHGILNRTHTNSVLLNDEWKSMMCGGNVVSGRTWNLNYHGERRAYYLDELFNESAPVPAFATESFNTDTADFVQVYRDEFTSTASTKWKLGQTNNGKATIENSMLKYESQSSVNLIVLIATPVNVLSDFSFECTLQYTGTDDSKYGIVYGTYTDENQQAATSGASLEYFLINNDQKATIGNRSWFSYFTQVTRDQIVPKSLNKIKVVKKGCMMYFFINGQYAYRSEMVNSANGYNFGFSVPPKSTLYADNFRIAQSSSSMNAEYRVKKAETSQFEIREIKAELGTGTIKNK